MLPLPDRTILVSSKNLNMVFIIDPTTDEVVWECRNDEMGGQHDAQLLDNGNNLVFANGAYSRDLHHSEVWEINPATNEIEWRYSARDNMTSFFLPHMGGAQRLPGGNTLICEGNKDCIFEVTPGDDVVREFISPHFVQSEQFGRHNWLFCARWCAPDSPEIRAILG